MQRFSLLQELHQGTCPPGRSPQVQLPIRAAAPECTLQLIASACATRDLSVPWATIQYQQCCTCHQAVTRYLRFSKKNINKTSGAELHAGICAECLRSADHGVRPVLGLWCCCTFPGVGKGAVPNRASRATAVMLNPHRCEGRSLAKSGPGTVSTSNRGAVNGEAPDEHYPKAPARQERSGANVGCFEMRKHQQNPGCAGGFILERRQPRQAGAQVQQGLHQLQLRLQLQDGGFPLDRGKIFLSGDSPLKQDNARAADLPEAGDPSVSKVSLHPKGRPSPVYGLLWSKKMDGLLGKEAPTGLRHTASSVEHPSASCYSLWKFNPLG